MEKYILNPVLSFREKNSSYALFINYNLFIFQDISYRLFKSILDSLANSECIEDRFHYVPNSFIEFLKHNKILIKE